MAKCETCGKELVRPKEQLGVRNVLLIADCDNPDCTRCGSTMTYGTRPHTEAEAAQIAEVIAMARAKRS